MAHSLIPVIEHFHVYTTEHLKIPVGAHMCPNASVCAKKIQRKKVGYCVVYHNKALHVKYCTLCHRKYRDGTINATYTQNVMGRPGVIPSRIQCNKTSGVT